MMMMIIIIIIDASGTIYEYLLFALPCLTIPFYINLTHYSSNICSIFTGIRRWDLYLLTAHSATLPSNPLSYASIYLHDLRENLRTVVIGTLLRTSGIFLNKSI